MTPEESRLTLLNHWADVLLDLVEDLEDDEVEDARDSMRDAVELLFESVDLNVTEASKGKVTVEVTLP